MRIVTILSIVIIAVASAFYFYMKTSEEKDDTNIKKPAYDVIGRSVENREIQAHRFGGPSTRLGVNGNKKLVLVGAIHGGYEWNTAVLAYEFIDYFTANQNTIPSDTEVVVIPVANPDGLYKVVWTSERFNAEDAPQFNYSGEVDPYGPVAAGRFNANGVDLNRNFDCNWKSEAKWENRPVDAGTAPFSEPEAQALRDFFLAESPEAVIFFHSAGGGVYTSSCEEGILPSTARLLEAYNSVASYPESGAYTDYEVTGDAGDWISMLGIPAITVELSTHSAIEFEKNLAGVKAVLIGL